MNKVEFVLLTKIFYLIIDMESNKLFNPKYAWPLLRKAIRENKRSFDTWVYKEVKWELKNYLIDYVVYKADAGVFHC